MIKELRNLFYILIIIIFIIFTLKHYFSDNYKKKYYKSLVLLKKNIIENNLKLITLSSDTENIILSITKKPLKGKKYKFWELLINN
jgi:hypothetical protein